MQQFSRYTFAFTGTQLQVFAMMRASLTWIAVTSLTVACTGTVTGGESGAAGGSDDSPTDKDAPTSLPQPGESAPLCKAPLPGLVATRRLTHTQFQNAIKQLFGAAAPTTNNFPKASIREGYRSFVDANSVTADGAEQIAAAATAIASKVTTDVVALAGCTPGATSDDACALRYIETLAQKAYRRPAEPAELATLKNTYAKLIGAAFTPAEALAGVIELVLQSPQFLYIAEFGSKTGASGDVVPLTDYEVASRLSFLLWDAPPNDELLQLARDAKLHTAKEVEAQARKMLQDPRTESVFGAFLEDWLELYRLDSQTKDPKRFPEWNDALATAMRSEVKQTAAEVAFRGDASLSSLLAGNRTMANAALAKIYGADTSMGDKFASVTLNESQRAGLLTSAAFLASHAGSQESFPVARGAFVRRHMLCQDIVIPANIVIEPPPVNPNVRGRERFNQHRDDPTCAGCHALMDPIGFGLEGYDALGRHRTSEGDNLSIDTSGDLTDAGDISGPFQGGPELAERLASSDVVQGCFVRQLFSYAVARAYGDEDACAILFVEKKFSESHGNLKELLVALSLSDNFLYRRVPQ
ncbi:MAG: DUF1592 domain-containing protein [Deltaproteobacteria bacterium]|nr:DUF1592 domain-containing protein [Deltaproteobacteria bacterium]